MTSETSSTLPETPHVFLAGTCGGDMWRTPFEDILKNANISFFNPQVDDWEPWMAPFENHCMHHSPLVLFPVLRSTLGMGSLAEIGFSILATLRDIKAGAQRDLIVYIEMDVDPAATIKETQPDGSKKTVPAGKAVIEESIRTRHLVHSKVEMETWRPGIHLVSSLEEMKDLMMVLAVKDARQALAQ